jgi:hypothetical protein
MALTYDQISAITQKAYVAKLADNYFNSNPLTKRLKEKSLELLDGGTSIMQPLGYSNITASGWYQGAETLSTTDNDVITAAEYQWKQHYANITLSRIDELKNSGDRAILSLVKEKTKVAERTMVDNLGTGVYSSGTDAKSIVGLRVIVATNQTVGGISQSTNSWWQAQVDSSTTTLTLGAMQTVYNNCTIDDMHPTVAMATRAVYNLFYALLQPQQRFMDSETAKAGFQNLMFNGIPVIADNKAPTGYMYFLNEDFLHLYVHKDENMRFEPFVKPINQNIRVAKIYWAGALGSSNNRLHGVLSAITA